MLKPPPGFLPPPSPTIFPLPLRIVSHLTHLTTTANPVGEGAGSNAKGSFKNAIAKIPKPNNHAKVQNVPQIPKMQSMLKVQNMQNEANNAKYTLKT